MTKPAILSALLLTLALAFPAAARAADGPSQPMPPEFDWSVDEPIIRARISTEAGIAGGEMPHEALLTSIVTWVANVVDLPAIYHHPEFARTARVMNVALLRGGFDWGRGRVSRYDDLTRTIYLSADWRGDSVEGLSILIHEMVHHLQNVGELRYECPQERARLAYIAQERWLALHRRSLAESFRIDPELRLFLTECHVP